MNRHYIEQSKLSTTSHNSANEITSVAEPLPEEVSTVVCLRETTSSTEAIHYCLQMCKVYHKNCLRSPVFCDFLIVGFVVTVLASYFLFIFSSKPSFVDHKLLLRVVFSFVFIISLIYVIITFVIH
jgi:hypothetical protein